MAFRSGAFTEEDHPVEGLLDLVMHLLQAHLDAPIHAQVEEQVLARLLLGEGAGDLASGVF